MCFYTSNTVVLSITIDLKKKLNFLLSHSKKLNAHQSKITDNRCIVRTNNHKYTKISFLKLVNITKFTKLIPTNIDEIKVELCYR